MAAIINPRYTNRNNLREWPLDVTEGLIKRRRFYKNDFFNMRLQEQRPIWTRISNFLFNNYNINTTENQCKTKWNSLIYGYNNLKRLNNNNPEGYRTFTPSYYDRYFFHEMSDEFWINQGNYLLI